jgi:OmpR-family two-component system manganese-sensing sensor histidine kinase
MFQTTRRRLALWYTTVTAVLLLLFASGFYLYVRSTLVERIDDTLNHVVEVVQRSLVIESVEDQGNGQVLRINLEASFRSNANAVEDDHIDLEWFSPTGELIWSTFSAPLDVPLHPSDGETVNAHIEEEGQSVLAKNPVPGDLPDEEQALTGLDWKERSRQNQADDNKIREPASPNSSFDLHPSSIALRQVTQRVQIGRQVVGYLRVSHPWFEVTKPSRQLIWDLSLGTALMVGAVAAIGWFLSGLAIAPVKDSYQRLKQFTADASHELRNPIAVIQTNVQVALADPDPHLQQDQLKVIERLVRRLGRLVDDLLFLARQDSGMIPLKLDWVPLDDLIHDVIEEQQAIATDKALTLSWKEFDLVPATGKDHPSVSPYRVQADRDQLIRLLTNLISNAIQYTPANGQIDVVLQRIKHQGTVQLRVQVSDTGIGIPADSLPHLFDRFYRVDPARASTKFPNQKPESTTGSGLGLAIAKAIVENHQGQIHIDSNPNQGTTVCVMLPCQHLDMVQHPHKGG